jgi:hypothetical protein
MYTTLRVVRAEMHHLSRLVTYLVYSARECQSAIESGVKNGQVFARIASDGGDLSVMIAINYWKTRV